VQGDSFSDRARVSSLRIGIAGPVDLEILKPLFAPNISFPPTYSFPLIATIAREFHQRGYDVAVFALSREVRQTQKYTGDRIQVFVCPERRPRFEMMDIFKSERRVLCQAMQEAQCDVIHAHWTYEFASAAIASRRPHLITAHDIPMVVLRFARHPYWLIKPLLAWKVLRTARAVTAVSPYVAKALNAFLRPQNDIEVVGNGVAAHVFEIQNPRSSADQAATIVFASVLNGWAGRKNGQKLVEAFALLRSRLGGKVELIMMGHGHDAHGPGAAWAAQRGLAAGIHFAGPFSQENLLAKLADDVDVLVHPSLEETFGMVIIEAMALGIPVIGGIASGAVPWVLAGGDAGVLTDVSSPRALTDAMFLLATNQKMRRDLATKARSLAKKKYGMSAVIDQYEKLLQAAIKEQA
jgi:glycosyltransferase involved in cell wall biosynthesis